MPTQDNAVTQYIASDEVFAVADVKDTNKLLYVSTDGFIVKRSDANGGNGEMTIVEDTNVTVHLTLEDTGKLPTGGSGYNLYRLKTDGTYEELFDGTTTVTAGSPPADGGPTSIVIFSNSNNMEEITTDGQKMLPSNDYILFEIDTPDDFDYELYDPALIPGKRIFVLQKGSGIVRLKYDSSEILVLNGASDTFIQLFSDGTDWIE